MSAAPLERIDRLFQEARRLPAEARAAFLDGACAGDEALRADVLGLLAEHDGDPGPLDEPALGSGFQVEVPGPLAESAPAPRRIGGYEVRRLLGEGGMGVVYLAEQAGTGRAVALKLLRPGFATPSMLRRFEHEAQILGRLRHPGIAQVYEAGVHEDAAGSCPFIAMEYVQGIPLTDFARRAGLDSRRRLELFVRVCDAVHHAHQKGVIHRDLKPGNILVEEPAEPKVLDFGVARLADADVRATAMRTGAGQLVGTLQYMSPEQASGDPRDRDVRSDVYSLGVICYELLSGRLPYDLDGTLILEAARIIREVEPRPLSGVARAFRGDLDCGRRSRRTSRAATSRRPRSRTTSGGTSATNRSPPTRRAPYTSCASSRAAT